MSAELDRMAERLEELAAMLRDPSLEEDRAVSLAAEAAELVAEASAAVGREAARTDTGETAPGQEELL